MFIYPDYAFPIKDFALLNLKKAIVFNSRTQPIKLPSSSSDTVYEGVEVFISGHGDTNDTLQSTELMRGIVTTIVDFGECNRIWNNGATLSSSNICTHPENLKSICPVCEISVV